MTRKKRYWMTFIALISLIDIVGSDHRWSLWALFVSGLAAGFFAMMVTDP